MMINKRLIGTVSESRKYVAANVALQWCSLVANIAMMTAITGLLASMAAKTADTGKLVTTAAVAAIAVIVRLVCTVGSSRMVFLSSRAVKKTLRERIYGKLLRLGAYLPQFFYAMLAPFTLFVYLCTVSGITCGLPSWMPRTKRS